MQHEADVSPAELYLTMLEDEKTMTFVKYQERLAKAIEVQNFKKILIDWLFEVGEQFC